MNSFKTNLLATTVVPAVLAAAAGMATLTVSSVIAPRPAMSACAPCNPCAAKNPCNPCAAINPCNPCAAANPCNPCAAANPCNPCAANPCTANAASNCVIPRLTKSGANPCNPCTPANPCNPCAAANPCSPCAAANPCNPCAAGTAVELTDAEAATAYDCLREAMRAAYGKSGNATATSYADWRRYSRVAYQSATHGGRYVQNYANATARAYGVFEKAGVMPVGSVLAKDSFLVDGNGKATMGPLFTMEKMPAGFSASSGDWKYTMIMPNGSVFGITNGKNSAGMQFCVECHAAVAEEQDHMMFLPDEYRTR